MSTERESDGIGELAEDLLRIAILIGTRLAQRHAQQRANRLEQAARQSEQARAREERIQALERDAALASLSGVRSQAWWDHADADDIRRAWTTAREWQGQDPRAGRGGLPDGRRAAPPLRAGRARDRSQRPGRTAADPGADDTERRASSSPTTSACTSSSSGSPSSARSSPATIRASTRARSSGCSSSSEQTVELTEIRDLIAEDLADRRQQEPEAPRGQDARERQERRELVDAELRTGAAAAGHPARRRSGRRGRRRLRHARAARAAT